MPTKRGLMIFLFLLIALPFVFAHAGEEYERDYVGEYKDFLPVGMLEFAGYGSVILAILLTISLITRQRLGEKGKQFLFWSITFMTLLITFYLVGTTLYVNMISFTGGPVHWHADFEIWACGKEVNFKDPEFPSNKLGTQMLHEHNDNRIHVEGVVIHKLDASLGAFFEVIGGKLGEEELAVPTNEGVKVWLNGQECPGGSKGVLYVFVNGKLVENAVDYVIAPYDAVPPGDTIKLVFTDEPLEKINVYTKGFGREMSI